MYEAKHAGKGRVELFGRDLDVRLTDRRELGNDLRFAVERGELELWYRPVASLDTGCIASLEGTVRWNHPTRGLLEPDMFIPIALRDRRDRADRRVGAHHRRHRHERVAARASRSRRVDHGVGAAAHARQRRAPHPCRSSTRPAPTRAASASRWAKTSVVHDFADTVAALRELHDGNVCVALDNFCGQLTVPQLHTLRPDTVKLDRSFLTLLGADVAVGDRDPQHHRHDPAARRHRGREGREQPGAARGGHLAQLRRRAGRDHRARRPRRGPRVRARGVRREPKHR